METMEIIIDSEGAVTITVKGVKGKSCKDVTKQIEKALGSVTSDKPTSEMSEEVPRVRRSN